MYAKTNNFSFDEERITSLLIDGSDTEQINSDIIKPINKISDLNQIEVTIDTIRFNRDMDGEKPKAIIILKANTIYTMTTRTTYNDNDLGIYDADVLLLLVGTIPNSEIIPITYISGQEL